MKVKDMVGMVKKVLKWVGIVFGAIVVILIVAAIALPYFLPLDKIKDMAAEKASAAIHRQVKIGKVSFNIFKGIELRDLSVGNRPGFSKEPFVSAGLIELKYDFLALLRGKVAVSRVVLVKPEILVEMRADGTSNYSDLVGVKKPAQPKQKKEAKKKEPVSLLVSKFQIKNGKLTLKQAGKVNQLKDLNVSVSNITLDSKKPIVLYVSVMGVYEGREVPISLDGNIWLHLDRSYIKISNLDLTAAGEKIGFSGEVSNFDKAPDIKLNVSTRKLDTDKFLAIVSGTGTKKPKVKTVLPYGTQTAKINKSLKSVPANIKLAATFDLNNVLFKEMKVNSVKGNVKMANKIADIAISAVNAYRGSITGNVVANLNVSGIGYTVNNLVGKGFDSTPFSNDVIESFLTKLPDYKDLRDKLDGALSFKLSMSGRGVETPDIIANAKGSGSFLLANGKISKLKSLSAVGEKIGLKMLQEDIALKEFKANFSFANKIVNIKDMTLNNGDEGDVKLAFDGSANVDTLEFLKDNTLALKLNPKTTKLSAEYDAFKDDKGWYSLDFEMVGSLKRPLPIPKMGSAVDQILKNKQKEAGDAAQKEIDLKKQEAQDELDRQKQEAEDKAKQELEDKAKELLKF